MMPLTGAPMAGPPGRIDPRPLCSGSCMESRLQATSEAPRPLVPSVLSSPYFVLAAGEGVELRPMFLKAFLTCTKASRCSGLYSTS